MRVLSDSYHLEVEPGTSATMTLEVVNTQDVIDGVSVIVRGLPSDCVSASPAMLPLFPDATGTMTVDLAVPTAHPAGRHPLVVEVVSHGTADPPRLLDVDLDVGARPGLRVDPKPRLIRGRRSARFVLEATNTGNVPLDVVMDARDPDRNVRTTFAPERRRIEPGSVAPIMMSVRGPRTFTGPEVDRTIVVSVEATPAAGYVPPGAPRPTDPPTPGDPAQPGTSPVLPDAPTAAAQDDDFAGYFTLERETTVQLRQRPFIGRGLLTVLILLSIVAVWAAIFLLGLGKVFAADPMTKEAPASFFASLNSPTGGSSGGAGTNGGTNGNASGNGNGSGGTSDNAAPAGALDKSGQLAPGMGGSISGKVIALNDQQPVGRILVVAYRVGRKGLVEMSSAATQTDGTYTLAGLFPTNYYLYFSATGYKPQWYPNAPSHSGGQLVEAVAQGTTTGIDATMTGLPASISGTIDPGDTLTPVVTQVTARPLLGANTGKAVATVKTDASGHYSLAHLPAPSTYELTFTTPGYQANTLTDSVAGGDTRLEPTVTLGATSGQISGTVRDGTTPLGGATISTTVSGTPLSVVTPTSGQVGVFALSNLPTPATYVVTVSAPGHGSVTRIVDLGAGKTASGLDFSLSNGTGSIVGKVIDTDKNGLGDATVTVGGAATGSGTAPTATTLTAGSPGSFTINGLATGGDYTLTVTLDGYAPETVPVPPLSANGGATTVTVTPSTQVGTLKGKVLDADGKGFSGATVTATNGRQSWTTTSNTADGSYLFDDLAPGSYSVTATSPGLHQQTALVTVTATKTTKQNLRVS